MPPSVLTRKTSSLSGSRATAVIAPPAGMAPVRMFHHPRHWLLATLRSPAAVWVLPSLPDTKMSSLLEARATTETGAPAVDLPFNTDHHPLHLPPWAFSRQAPARTI